MKTAASLVLALLLSGCYSNPVKVNDAEAVAPTQAYVSDGKPAGTVIFVRDSGASGVLHDLIVFVDGKRVGVLRPAQKLSVSLPEGTHVVGVNCNSCSEEARKEIQHVVTRGRTDAFRVNFAAGLNIQPSTLLD